MRNDTVCFVLLLSASDKCSKVIITKNGSPFLSIAVRFTKQNKKTQSLSLAV